MWAAIAAWLLWQTPDFNSEGLQALEQGKYEVAVDDFQKSVAANPGDYSAHFNLALAYSLLHQDTQAIAEYRKTLELKPRLYEAELNAGILLLRQKDFEAARPLLEDAASQKPGEFQPRSYAALAQLETGSLEKAQASYRLALTLNPKSADCELGLGRSLARAKQLEEAAPHYRQAAQLDSKFRDYLLELAAFYEQAKQPQKAIAIYREFPDNPAARGHLGELLLETQDYRAAIPELEAAYAGHPTPASRTNLAMAYVLSGQQEKALPLLDQAVASEPSNYDLRLVYARALRDRKQYAAAANQFLAAVKLNPKDARAWRDLGGVL